MVVNIRYTGMPVQTRSEKRHLCHMSKDNTKNGFKTIENGG